ncbi:hypothetical protein PR202_gb17918 [Eleusine coracana subsp. coracana]|uniref:Uncharacterized protein n=1 Tax=Eleusine coracana subsp. coracana TaxID=191504 RepID=A0AAV5F1W9_ELECO|nr:hypothetical protein PR202_gb17918 [Eleusine coracana subsp. coracana]
MHHLVCDAEHDTDAEEVFIDYSHDAVTSLMRSYSWCLTSRLENFRHRCSPCRSQGWRTRSTSWRSAWPFTTR